jgi:hypothetical protein
VGGDELAGGRLVGVQLRIVPVPLRVVVRRVDHDRVGQPLRREVAVAAERDGHEHDLAERRRVRGVGRMRAFAEAGDEVT